ncbi:MAG: hypothetical protein Q4G33_11555 [bacterium]|nr:hypothetical protein [bacterium]
MLDIICLDKYGNPVDHLTQWDYNQRLVIRADGLDTADISQVHFSNQNSTEAYCVPAASDSDGNITAAIPNPLLTEPYAIYAYIWASEGESGRTKYVITIPVRKRAKPHGFEYVENIEVIDIIQLRNEIAQLTELKTDINNKVDKTQYASTSQYGIIKISSSGAITASTGVLSANTNSSYGTQKVNNSIAVSPATESEISAQTQAYKPIVPKTLKKAVETIGGIRTDLETENKTSYVSAINEVNDNGYYTNASPTPTALGGIKSGTTFNNESVKSILEKLLYPYVSFSIPTGNTTTYLEWGAATSLASVNVSVIKGSSNITSFEINAGGTITNNTAALTTLNALSSGTSKSISTTINYTASASGNSTVAVTVSDGTTTKTQTLRTYTHIYPYYYGAIDSGTQITPETIPGLTKNLTAKGTKTFSYTLNNQIAVFACPSSYGNATITDASTGVEYSFNKTAFTIENSYGYSCEYYVYSLAQAATGTFTFKFTH